QIQRVRRSQLHRACEPILNPAWDDLSIGSSEGPVLRPIPYRPSFWMVRVIGSGLDPNLEADGRSIPYPVPLGGCGSWNCRPRPSQAEARRDCVRVYTVLQGG